MDNNKLQGFLTDILAISEKIITDNKESILFLFQSLEENVSADFQAQMDKQPQLLAIAGLLYSRALSNYNKAKQESDLEYAQTHNYYSKSNWTTGRHSTNEILNSQVTDTKKYQEKLLVTNTAEYILKIFEAILSALKVRTTYIQEASINKRFEER